MIKVAVFCYTSFMKKKIITIIALIAAVMICCLGCSSSSKEKKSKTDDSSEYNVIVEELFGNHKLDIEMSFLGKEYRIVKDGNWAWTSLDGEERFINLDTGYMYTKIGNEGYVLSQTIPSGLYRYYKATLLGNVNNADVDDDLITVDFSDYTISFRYDTKGVTEFNITDRFNTSIKTKIHKGKKSVSLPINYEYSDQKPLMRFKVCANNIEDVVLPLQFGKYNVGLTKFNMADSRIDDKDKNEILSGVNYVPPVLKVKEDGLTGINNYLKNNKKDKVVIVNKAFYRKEGQVSKNFDNLTVEFTNNTNPIDFMRIFT